MQISIQVEAMLNVNWAMWKEMLPRLEETGFATIFRSDHFSLGNPPSTEALELITSMTYAAEHTRKVNIGSLVAPLSVRDPVMLARQAMSIDILSGGRMILGVGSGWNEEEHRHFGYNLGDMHTRMDRLAEGLEVMYRLMRSDEPLTFEGRFTHLHDARLVPRPERPTRLLVGGNGQKRTLPLAARYADIWNCLNETPERFQELSMHLDELLKAEGRTPGDVRRSIMKPLLCYRSQEELRSLLDANRRIGSTPHGSDEEILARLARMDCFLGGPDEVIRYMEGYADAGVEEFVIQWYGLHDLRSLDVFADEVIPHFIGK